MLIGKRWVISTLLFFGVAFLVFWMMEVLELIIVWRPSARLEKLLQIQLLRDQWESRQILINAWKEAIQGEEHDQDRRSVTSKNLDYKPRLRSKPNNPFAQNNTPLRIPLESDVICQGYRGAQDRTCRIRNLCYATKPDRFFILRGANSFIFPSPKSISEPITNTSRWVDLTTVDEHNVFYWTFEEAPPNFFASKISRLLIREIDTRPTQKKGGLPVKARKLASSGGILANLTLIHGPVYLFKHFFSVNIMHVVHDDWLGLVALRDVWPQLVDQPPTLVSIDHGPRGPYDEIFNWVGRVGREGGSYYTLEELLGWRGWPKKPNHRPEAYLCFADAIVGSSKDLSWYQYGYGKPQGPIPDKEISGTRIKEAAWQVLQQLGLPSWDQTLINRTMQNIISGLITTVGDQDHSAPCIAIFARRSNRLILNEAQLATTLSNSFGLPICWIRLEDYSLPRLIKRLRRAVAAFGMHGSILVLGMFLPPGAVLIEGFPYGVPPGQYTPYLTMARLQGMGLRYHSWSPMNPEASIGHPDREPREGGIRHLNEEQRQFIMNSPTIPPHPCCDNPHWLYRIFQDTTVDAQAIVELIRKGLQEG